MKFISDKVVARNELAVKKGQLAYLKNLAKVISAVMLVLVTLVLQRRSTVFLYVHGGP